MQDVSAKQQTKQKYKPNHQETGLSPHSAWPIRGKTNKQKLSRNLNLYKAYTTTGPTLGGQKPKGRKKSTFFKKEFNLPSSLGKGDLKHNKLKKKIMRSQRNTTQMKEQTRNTEVQISEEKIGKLPEKEFRKK